MSLQRPAGLSVYPVYLNILAHFWVTPLALQAVLFGAMLSHAQCWQHGSAETQQPALVVVLSWQQLFT